MNPILVEKIALKEVDQLQKICTQTFRETYASGNSSEDMQAYLTENFKTDKLISELGNPASEFHFAKLNGSVIGYLKINFGTAQTEPQQEKALEIEGIYVLKDFQGKSVGQISITTAFEIVKRARVDYLWLGVWEKNISALHFYRRNGFSEFDKHIFKVGNDVQKDIMMKFRISNFQICES
ncbi:MAG: GNAT family N-acetyltransferase [Gloeobacteraceae cyanobacterium ES-bin-316]|nr:GNAT family N-acetyltransferase [Ferruginibacter sp.]